MFWGNSNPAHPICRWGRVIDAYVARQTKVILLAEAAARYIEERGDTGMTTHWENRALLQEQIGLGDGSQALATERGQITTSAGMGSTVDVVLTLMARHIPTATVSTVADILLHDRIRDLGTLQPFGGKTIALTGDRELDLSIELMQANIEEPLPIADIVRLVGVSSRSLERRFRRALNARPAEYYRACGSTGPTTCCSTPRCRSTRSPSPVAFRAALPRITGRISASPRRRRGGGVSRARFDSAAVAGNFAVEQPGFHQQTVVARLVVIAPRIPHHRAIHAAIRHHPGAAQVFDRVFEIGFRIEKIRGLALKPHLTGGGGQDLHHAIVWPVARLGAVIALALDDAMDERAGHLVVIGVFVHQLADFRGFATGRVRRGGPAGGVSEAEAQAPRGKAGKQGKAAHRVSFAAGTTGAKDAGAGRLGKGVARVGRPRGGELRWGVLSASRAMPIRCSTECRSDGDAGSGRGPEAR